MRKIRLFFAAMALLVSALAYGQTLNVTGTVVDSSNDEPIPFASIQLKGTMTGASTDASGNFSISVPSNGTLVFSSVGYVTQEVAVNGRVASSRKRPESTCPTSTSSTPHPESRRGLATRWWATRRSVTLRNLERRSNNYG